MANDLSDIYLVPAEKLVPRIESIPNGTTYTSVFMDRPGTLTALSPTTAGTIYVYPTTSPSSDTQAIPFTGGVASLPGVGRFYVRHSGSGAENFRVAYDGAPGGASEAPASLQQTNVAQIGGTAQSGIDVAKAYDKCTWGTPSLVSYAAGNTLVVAANGARRFLSVFNLDTAQSVALTTEDPATAVRGFIILPPGCGYIFTPMDAITQQKINSWGTGTGTNKLSVCEGT